MKMKTYSIHFMSSKSLIAKLLKRGIPIGMLLFYSFVVIESTISMPRSAIFCGVETS